MNYIGTQREDVSKKANPSKGQGLVEFALLLPILVLIIFGVLELGRAFFAFIAISNAAREGARVFTFRPDVTTVANVQTAVTTEVGNSPLVDKTKITSIQIECGIDSGAGYTYTVVTGSTSQIVPCSRWGSILVTVTYNHPLIFDYFSLGTLTLKRSAEMMVP
jgi:Flp pilus assembly protein TadG